MIGSALSRLSEGRNPIYVALGVSLGVIVAYLLGGGAAYKPLSAADPCETRPLAVTDPVGGDQHGGRVRHRLAIALRHGVEPASRQLGQHALVVDQLPVDRHLLGPRYGVRRLERVPHAEAESHRSCPDDSHLTLSQNFA